MRFRRDISVSSELSYMARWSVLYYRLGIVRWTLRGSMGRAKMSMYRQLFIYFVFVAGGVVVIVERMYCLLRNMASVCSTVSLMIECEFLFAYL